MKKRVLSLIMLLVFAFGIFNPKAIYAADLRIKGDGIYVQKNQNENYDMYIRKKNGEIHLNSFQEFISWKELEDVFFNHGDEITITLEADGSVITRKGRLGEADDSSYQHRVQPRTGWFQDPSGSWYYLNKDGAIQTGWIKDKEVWYYLDPQQSGKMISAGWKKISGEWYHFSSSGAMSFSRWESDNGVWFYLGPDGTIKRDSWIENYYVDANGRWVLTR